MSTRAPALAVLVKRFPKLSETFIAGEIASLMDLDGTVRVYSMYPPVESVPHANTTRILPKVTYLTDRRNGWLSQSLRCVQFLAWLLLFPSVWLKTVRCLASGGSFVVMAQLFHHCRRDGIELLHVHYISEPSAMAEVVCTMLVMRQTISAHAKDIYLTPVSELRRRLRFADVVATCTSHNVDYLVTAVPEWAHKVQLIHHGIDTAFFKGRGLQAIGTADVTSADAPLVLSVGRFKAKKGFDVLIEACALLRDRSVSFQCDIVGYGDEQPALEALISRLGLTPQVRLCAAMNHAELKEALCNAAVFAMPCRITADGDRDGIPNALLEAMSCERAVVATGISGIPEVLTDDVNGRIIPPEDPHALAEVLAELLSDPAGRVRLGREARQTVARKFSWQRNVSALYDLMLDRPIETGLAGEMQE